MQKTKETLHILIDQCENETLLNEIKTSLENYSFANDEASANIDEILSEKENQSKQLFDDTYRNWTAEIFKKE